MAAEGWVTMTEQISAVSRSRNVGQLLENTLSIDTSIFAIQRFVPGICGVECGSRCERSGPKFDFLRPKFVNRHHFRPTSQVWMRSHGWSFICADEIKQQ